MLGHRPLGVGNGKAMAARDAQEPLPPAGPHLLQRLNVIVTEKLIGARYCPATEGANVRAGDV